MFSSWFTENTNRSFEFSQRNFGPQMGRGADFGTDLQKIGLLKSDINNNGCGSRFDKCTGADHRDIIDWTRAFHHGLFYEHISRNLFIHFVGRGFIRAGADHEQEKNGHNVICDCFYFAFGMAVKIFRGNCRKKLKQLKF
jgi:hypothetical protein